MRSLHLFLFHLFTLVTMVAHAGYSLTSFKSSLTGMVPTTFQGFQSTNKLRPFSTDGCSLSPNGIPWVSTDAWVDCCIVHDKIYWAGGTKEEKNQADGNLRSCIASKGYPRIANWYYRSVQKFGVPQSNKTYRWGYGWTHRRDYGPLEDWELEQVRALRSTVEKAPPPTLVLAVFDEVLPGYSYEEIQIMKYLQKHLRTQDRIETLKKYVDPTGQVLFWVELTSCRDGLYFYFKSSLQVAGTKSCSSIRE